MDHFKDIRKFINSSTFCKIGVKVFYNRAPEDFSQDSLVAILDRSEATASMLNMRSFKQEMKAIFTATEADRSSVEHLVVVAYEKDHANIPVGMALFKLKDINSCRVLSFPLLQEVKFAAATQRNKYWELSYCVRELAFRGKCIGHVCVSAGLESIRGLSEDQGYTANVWLVVAGSFKNSRAVRLYLDYGFGMKGVHGDECSLVMLTKDFGEASYRKAQTVLERALETTFLLPELKRKYLAPGALQPSTSQIQDTDPEIASQTRNPTDRNSESSSSSGDDNDDLRRGNQDSDDDGSHQPKRQRRPAGNTSHQSAIRPLTIGDSVAEVTGGRTVGHLKEFVNTLSFRKFIDQLKWKPTLIKSVRSSEITTMVEKASQMVKSIVEIETTCVILQHLELAKQLDILAECRNIHAYSLVKEMCSEGHQLAGLSGKYAISLLKVAYATYRYPVLAQTEILWRHALAVLPTIANYFDHLVYENKPLPANVVLAQQERHQVCLRLSIWHPTLPVGDGDGLPPSKVHKIFGFYENDEPIQDDEVKDILWNQYKSYFGERSNPTVEGVEIRSRILGYDTQETPKPGDGSLRGITQQYWRQGKDFLDEQLQHLRAGKSIQSCKILLDVYGTDPYHRFVVDIRAMSNEESQEPQLHRFQLAERALETGYAVPTAAFYSNPVLHEKFQASIDNKRGGFAAGASEFIHPMKCRRARYNRELDKSYHRRSRYTE